MIKKAMLLGVVCSSIMLIGCNGEQKEAQSIEVNESDQEVIVGQADDLLSELRNEIMVSITEQTELDSESIAIMVGGGQVNRITDVSISFPKDVKVDDAMIRQIIEDSIKKVSGTENAMSEENVIIKIDKY